MHEATILAGERIRERLETITQRPVFDNDDPECIEEV